MSNFLSKRVATKTRVPFHLSAMQLPQQMRRLCMKCINKLKKINTFESVPPSDEPHILHNQTISTWLFILLLISSIAVLLFYNTFIPVQKTFTVKQPTYDQYLNLFAKYPNNLQCPCKTVSITYDRFLNSTIPHITYVPVSSFPSNGFNIWRFHTFVVDFDIMTFVLSAISLFKHYALSVSWQTRRLRIVWRVSTKLSMWVHISPLQSYSTNRMRHKFNSSSYQQPRRLFPHSHWFDKRHKRMHFSQECRQTTTCIYGECQEMRSSSTLSTLDVHVVKHHRVLHQPCIS